ncbi:Uncharacterised protein [Mycobacteroides abscessus subsp. abscessus]|nr:Uncharacterised protein [Mycobacteroides abscessus subsp. abscessus]
MFHFNWINTRWRRLTILEYFTCVFTTGAGKIRAKTTCFQLHFAITLVTRNGWAIITFNFELAFF